MAIETVIVDGTDGFAANDLVANFSSASSQLRRLQELVQDTMNVTQSDSEDYLFSPTIADGVISLDTIIGIMSTSEEIYDAFDLQDSQIVPFFDTLTSSFNSTGASSYDPAFFHYLADSLVMKGLASSRIVGYNLIQEYINLLGALVAVYGATILESFNLTATDLVTNITGYTELLDSLTVTASTSYTGGAVIILKDSVNISEDITINQILTELLQDVIHFGGVIDFGGDSYTFVLNTENEAISTYTNYNFNSISNGLGATDTGIYDLVGATDSGDDINASVKTGLMDFGSNQHKQIPYAYIGLTKDGNAVLKTIVNAYGTKKERWYNMTLGRNATDTVRVKLGRGVKSRYWQFELMNVAGSDLDVESFDLLPLTLKRRI